jgi:hypothetical protein
LSGILSRGDRSVAGQLDDARSDYRCVCQNSQCSVYVVEVVYCFFVSPITKSCLGDHQQSYILCWRSECSTEWPLKVTWHYYQSVVSFLCSGCIMATVMVARHVLHLKNRHQPMSTYASRSTAPQYRPWIILLPIQLSCSCDIILIDFEIHHVAVILSVFLYW